VAEDGCAGVGDGAVPLGNEEAGGGMGLGASGGAVMAEEDFLDFAKCFCAIHVRLALPEHDESLSADAALGFGVCIGAFAQNLHGMLLALGRLSASHEMTIARGNQS